MKRGRIEVVASRLSYPFSALLTSATLAEVPVCTLLNALLVLLLPSMTRVCPSVY